MCPRCSEVVVVEGEVKGGEDIVIDGSRLERWRAEAAPAQAPAPTPRARPAARFRSTKAAKDVPPTAGHPVDLDVPPPNPKAPPAPAGGTRAYAPAPTREHHRR